MTEITRDQIKGYCDALELMTREAADDASMLWIGLRTRIAVFETAAWVRVEREAVFLRVPGLVPVPDVRRGEVAKMLCHINYALVFGRFAMDARDGEIVFDAGLMTDIVGLPKETFSRALRMIASAVETHLPAIVTFVAADLPLESLMSQANDDPTESLREALDDEDDEEAESA